MSRRGRNGIGWQHATHALDQNFGIAHDESRKREFFGVQRSSRVDARQQFWDAQVEHHANALVAHCGIAVRIRAMNDHQVGAPLHVCRLSIESIQFSSLASQLVAGRVDDEAVSGFQPSVIGQRSSAGDRRNVAWPEPVRDHVAVARTYTPGRETNLQCRGDVQVGQQSLCELGVKKAVRTEMLASSCGEFANCIASLVGGTNESVRHFSGLHRKLALKLGYTNASFLSQMAGPNPIRNFTEETAREYEKKLGLPAGSLDVEVELEHEQRLLEVRSPGRRSRAAPLPTGEHEARVRMLDTQDMMALVRMVGRVCAEENVNLSPMKYSDIIALVIEDCEVRAGQLRHEYIRTLVGLTKQP